MTWCIPLSRAAIAVGADGIIVDVHPQPAIAMCDGDQALTGDDIRELALASATMPQLVGKSLTPARPPADPGRLSGAGPCRGWPPTRPGGCWPRPGWPGWPRPARTACRTWCRSRSRWRVTPSTPRWTAAQGRKATAGLRRLDNIRRNPAVALLADHYAEDWSALWWARADGQASVIDDPALMAGPARLLADRYPQYAAVPLPGPVIAIHVTRWSGWAAAPGFPAAG